MTTLLLVALTGCAARLPFPQPTATPNLPLPDSQQIFRPQEIGPANGDLETLDPALIEFQTDYDNAQLIFPALVTLDEQSKPVDWAATSHDVSADGLTYTFHLRVGMAWSDGTPIDANAFAYAINRSEDPCTYSPVTKLLDAIKGATTLSQETCPTGAAHVRDTLVGKSVIVSDPQTLTILLSQPAGYFLTALTSATAWAVPQQLIEQYADKWTEHLTEYGGFSGNLYRLTKWDHAGHLEFERNERFWGQKPVLRRIEYTLYKSMDTAWADFTAGRGDTSQPPLALLDAAKRMKGVSLRSTPLFVVSYLQVHGNLAPFDDVRVRQAFSLAIDRQVIVHAVFHDTAQPSIHLIPEGMTGYTPDLADAPGRSGAEALTADLLAARHLANAYAAEKCGGDFAHCPPITILGFNSSSTGAAFIAAIISGWQQAFPSWTIHTTFPRHGCPQFGCPPVPYQAAVGGWLFDYPDPHDLLSQVWTTQGAGNLPDRKNNVDRFSFPQVDALCAQAEAATDQATRLQLYRQAEQLLVAQGFAIPLYQTIQTTAMRSRIVGWRMGPLEVTPLSVWQQVYIRR
jgi:peptide/nickel transport system substrate-binding protein/oligopeptide transport system substrate-binding protein